jgi:transketolase
MIGVAAGLSSVGMIPFAHSFGPFASRRVVDQIFISCAYAKQNVKILGSDAGVTAAYNGGTHMPFEDMGCLNSIAGITLVEPTDSVMVKWLVKKLAETYGVQYIRMNRKLSYGVFEEGSEFELGKAATLRDGTDVCIVASGIMVEVALRAADELQKEGISAAVLNTFTWKPMDEEALARYSKKCGCFVTAENHNVVGGLGSIVSSALAKTVPAPVEMVGIYDTFGEVGTEAFLRERFDLTPAAVVAAAKRAIARK